MQALRRRRKQQMTVFSTEVEEETAAAEGEADEMRKPSVFWGTTAAIHYPEPDWTVEDMNEALKLNNKYTQLTILLHSLVNIVS